MRFDYAHTGDSAGAQDDPDAVAGWLRSVVDAVELARATGVSSVSLVGLRSGALLASTAAPLITPAIDSLVLWDPIMSGRSHLREQRAQYTTSIGADDPSDPRISILGGVLDPAAVSALGTLKIDPSGLAGVRTLLATRTAATYIRLHVRDRARVATTADGRPVVETLEELGPNGLFAIRTHTTGGDRAGGGSVPTVLFHTTAYEHRVGPGRLWVETARSLAAGGVSSVRYDRRGTGNSSVVDPDNLVALYSDDSDRDAAEAAVSDPRELVMTGLCSGAWYSVAVALRVRPRAMILTDLILWSVHRRRSLREQLAPRMPTGDPSGGGPPVGADRGAAAAAPAVPGVAAARPVRHHAGPGSAARGVAQGPGADHSDPVRRGPHLVHLPARGGRTPAAAAPRWRSGDPRGRVR